MPWTRPGWLRSVLGGPGAAAPPATLRFLRPGVESTPELAVDLIGQEQIALAELLPAYLDGVREETRGVATASATTRHHAAVATLKEIERVIASMAGPAAAPSTSMALSRLAERSELLRLLSDSVRELADVISQGSQSGPLAMLTGNMAESLHALLLTAADAITTPDAANLDLLHQLTADRGHLMEGIRGALVRGERTLSLEEHQTLFTSTSLFERIIRLLRRLHAVLGPAR
jgi:hypothetical protein